MTRDSVIKTGLLGAAAAFFGSARPAGAVSGYDRTVRLWESPLFNPNDLTPALRNVIFGGSGPVVVELPRSTTWIRGTADLRSGTCVAGPGASGLVVCTQTPFRTLPGNELGPSWVEGLRLHAADGSAATNLPAFDTSASLSDENQTVRGVVFRDIRLSNFGLGWRIVGHQRSSWRDITAHGCKRALDIVGRNAVLNFDHVIFEDGADRAVLIDAENAFSSAMPENTQFTACQFLGYDVGIERRRALFTVFRGIDLDGIRKNCFRYTDDNGGVVIEGAYMNVKAGGTAILGEARSSDNYVTIANAHLFGEGASYGVKAYKRPEMRSNRIAGFAIPMSFTTG